MTKTPATPADSKLTEQALAEIENRQIVRRQSPELQPYVDDIAALLAHCAVVEAERDAASALSTTRRTTINDHSRVITQLRARLREVEQERDRLKAENERLRDELDVELSPLGR